MGYMARVSLEPIKHALSVSTGALDEMLGPWELRANRRSITLKRRAEFIGGRVAAKLAFVASSEQSAAGLSSLAALDISRRAGSMPTVYHRGVPVGLASISHSGRWAMAIASPFGRAAIDIEDFDWHGKINEKYFSSYELSEIRDPDEARTRWTIKECCFKLANTSELDLVDELVTVFHGTSRWMAVSRRVPTLEGAVLGVFHWGSFVGAVGVVPKHNSAFDALRIKSDC